MNRVRTPPVAMAKLAPMSESVGAPVPSLAELPSCASHAGSRCRCSCRLLPAWVVTSISPSIRKARRRHPIRLQRCQRNPRDRGSSAGPPHCRASRRNLPNMVDDRVRHSRRDQSPAACWRPVAQRDQLRCRAAEVIGRPSPVVIHFRMKAPRVRDPVDAEVRLRKSRPKAASPRCPCAVPGIDGGLACRWRRWRCGQSGRTVGCGSSTWPLARSIRIAS